jgi:hypothetical protein
MKEQPNAEAFQKMASRLREDSRQWDALNIQLDELIAKVEEESRQSPFTQYRLKKAEQVDDY